MVFDPIPAWNVIVFDNTDENHKIAARHFSDYLFSAYMNHPTQEPDLKYYLKHTESHTVIYLSPSVSSFSAELLYRYGGQMLLNEPNLSECQEFFL